MLSTISDEKLVADFLNEHKYEDRDGSTKNWKLLITENEINKINDYVADEINKKFIGKKIVIASILKGAVYFTVDLTRRLTIPYSLYFIEASSYKNKQTQCEELELLSKIIPSKFEGKTVILIDELFDNGLTLHQVKSKLLSEVPTLKEDDIFTCVLFKKDKETSYPSPDLIGFNNLPNVWVVGYGLDDKQEKRGWKHLFAVPKSEGIIKHSHDNLFDDPDYYDVVRNDIKSHISELSAKM